MLLGTLKPGELTVDRLALGTPAADLGPLRVEPRGSWLTASGTHVWLDLDGTVCHIEGKSLERAAETIARVEEGSYKAEARVGPGRLNRWLDYDADEVYVDAGDGVIERLRIRTAAVFKDV